MTSTRLATDRRNSPGGRHRDAANTRRQLLEAARRRFARDGYIGTTVRDIADDVGVNAALVSRYFGSKEDLFEACIQEAVDDLTASASEVKGLPQVVAAISRNAVGVAEEGGPGQVLLLLLRSSGDASAERKRTAVLRGFGLRLASAAGWTADQGEGDELVLRGQLILSVAVGIAVLRSSAGLEPLGSATEEELSAPLLDLVAAVLGPRAPSREAEPLARG